LSPGALLAASNEGVVLRDIRRLVPDSCDTSLDCPYQCLKRTVYTTLRNEASLT